MNCLSYALAKLAKEGGYLMVRRSKFAAVHGITNRWSPFYWVPHFLHRSRAGVVTQYRLTDDQCVRDWKRGAFRSWLGLWDFDGAVAGDDDLRFNRRREGF